MAEKYPPKRIWERELQWGRQKREVKGGEGVRLEGLVPTRPTISLHIHTHINTQNQKTKQSKKSKQQQKTNKKISKTKQIWFFRYERAIKKIVNYGHFMIIALLDAAQVVVLRPPVCWNLTTVKPNLGQLSESVTSILKINRDTGCYWLLSCLDDIKSTVQI